MKKQFMWMFCVVACLVLGILLFFGTSGGLGHFSPYTLEYKIQSEFTIFGGEIPVYRSSPQNVENELATFIHEDGYVMPMQPEIQRWESIFHWNHAWKDGHGPLYDVFVRHRREIIAWSRANPERARIYWSEGFRHLRSSRKVDVWTGREILKSCWRSQTIPELRERIADVKKEVADLSDKN